MGEGFIIDDRNIKLHFVGKAQPTQVIKKAMIETKKVLKVFHTCEQCQQPIIYYGRMIPCKVSFHLLKVSFGRPLNPVLAYILFYMRLSDARDRSKLPALP